MKAEEGALIDAFEESLSGIDLLVERKLLQPALVLVYATMDAAAWLDIPGAGDVDRDGFVRWVERYVLPDASLECSALELYGARCGLLHSLTAFSRLHRQGKVRALGYAWGKASAKDLSDAAYFLRRPDIVGVHVDDLLAALRRAIQRFLNDAGADPQRWANVTARAKNLFSNLPQFAMVAVVEKHRGQDA